MLSYIPHLMSTAAKSRAGRKKLGKETVTFRLLPSTRSLLEKVPLGELRFLSLSDYCEQAILAQLKKDGIR